MHRAADTEIFLEFLGRVFAGAKGHRRDEPGVGFVLARHSEKEGVFEAAAQLQGMAHQSRTTAPGESFKDIAFSDLQFPERTGLAEIKCPRVEAAGDRRPFEREKAARKSHRCPIIERSGHLLHPDGNAVIARDFASGDPDPLESHRGRERARPSIDRIIDPPFSLDADGTALGEGPGEGKRMDFREPLPMSPTQKEEGGESPRGDHGEGAAAAMQMEDPEAEKQGGGRKDPAAIVVDQGDPGYARGRGDHQRTTPDRGIKPVHQPIG